MKSPSVKVKQKKPIVMVSSVVYGMEELLDRIYDLLVSMNYEVWMSHKGTLPVTSEKSAFENCLDAVDKCDLFLGIITPHYGSGQEQSEKSTSITHQEMSKAMQRKNLPRWVLVHDRVVFAVLLLKNLGYKGKSGRKKLKLKKNSVFDDLRILDLYEEIAMKESPLRPIERRGNWAQNYQNKNEAEIFVLAQFSRHKDAEEFIKENFPKKEEKL